MKYVLAIVLTAVITLLIAVIQLEMLLFGGKVLYDEDPKPQRKKEYKIYFILWGVFMIGFIAYILLKHVFKII
jgi:hypothetical protein